MLSFDDGALARLMIAATAVAPEKRAAWLEEIAERLDPPSNGEIPQHSHRETTEPARRGERQHRGRNALKSAAIAACGPGRGLVEKTAARRQQRRAADMRAYRKRQNAGIALFYVAADEATYEMMKHFGGLDPNKVEDKQAVRAALGRLLRAGLKALLEREAAHH
jgi:hypothetical protein